jgi:hypothetical protein
LKTLTNEQLTVLVGMILEALTFGYTPERFKGLQDAKSVFDNATKEKP